MNSVSRIATTTDAQCFTAKAANGDTYYFMLHTEQREEAVAQPGDRHIRLVTRTTQHRQIYRVSPYAGARPVRVGAHSYTSTTAREGPGRLQ